MGFRTLQCFSVRLCDDGVVLLFFFRFSVCVERERVCVINALVAVDNFFVKTIVQQTTKITPSSPSLQMTIRCFSVEKKNVIFSERHTIFKNHKKVEKWTPLSHPQTKHHRNLITNRMRSTKISCVRSQWDTNV